MFCGNNPVNFTDPWGLDERIAEEYHWWTDPDVWRAMGEGALDGIQAWIDGVIPFADPLGESLRYYDVDDPYLQLAQVYGGISRNALFSAGNLYAAGRLVPGISGFDRVLLANTWLGATVNATAPPVVSGIYGGTQIVLTGANVVDTAIGITDYVSPALD